MVQLEPEAQTPVQGQTLGLHQCSALNAQSELEFSQFRVACLGACISSILRVSIDSA